MTVTIDKNDFIIRVSKNTNLDLLQRMFEHIRSQEIVAKSKATNRDVDYLVKLTEKKRIKRSTKINVK